MSAGIRFGGRNPSGMATSTTYCYDEPVYIDGATNSQPNIRQKCVEIAVTGIRPGPTVPYVPPYTPEIPTSLNVDSSGGGGTVFKAGYDEQGTYCTSPSEGKDVFVSDSLLSIASRPLLSGNRELPPNGQIFFTPPSWYEIRPADNGQGLVWRPPGQDKMGSSQARNANIFRIGEPNRYTTYAYMKFYNVYGQPISPYSGRTVCNNDARYPLSGAAVTK